MKNKDKIDNIDIAGVSALNLESDKRQEAYEKYYEDLAKKNLQHVDSGTVKECYGRDPIDRKNWGIWHIGTQSYTFPRFKNQLAGLFGTDKTYKTGLDLGCGTVTFFDFIEVEDPILIDLSPSYCEFMKNKGWNTILANAEEIPLPDRWANIIVCSDLLEHALSFNHVLSEIKRVLKDDGVLLVNVPWKQNLNSFSTEARQGFPHLRSFDDKNIKDRFSDWKVLASEVIPKKGHIATINLIFKKKSEPK